MAISRAISRRFHGYLKARSPRNRQCFELARIQFRLSDDFHWDIQNAALVDPKNRTCLTHPFVENINMEVDTVNIGTAKKAWEILISMWVENECLFDTSSLDFKQHKVTTFQNLRRISLQNGNQIAAKFPLNRSSNRRKIVSVHGLYSHSLFEFDTLPREDALCKCVTVVPHLLSGRLLCVTILLSIHSQNLGRWCDSALLRAGSKIFLPLRSRWDQFLFRCFANYEFLFRSFGFANYRKPKIFIASGLCCFYWKIS